MSKINKATSDLFDASSEALRKLKSYVGFCTGDKELAEVIVPNLRKALQAYKEATRIEAPHDWHEK